MLGHTSAQDDYLAWNALTLLLQPFYSPSPFLKFALLKNGHSIPEFLEREEGKSQGISTKLTVSACMGIYNVMYIVTPIIGRGVNKHA